MEIRINPEQITHIKIYNSICENYVWCDKKSGKSLFWGLISDSDYEEGYYPQGIQTWRTQYLMLTKEDVNKEYYDIDGVLYRTPRIEIFAGKEIIKRKYFKTVEEAKEYCDKTFPNINVVI